ncbi:membrane-bound alpha-1,6- mannosyltransferase Initiation-specific [Physocladia obscura]|uniref:Membrane-bound alpha-1,6- mannosyltransferase Initiation-specific n=1 Tax=Physocladia obscura TaxID=109957 RepID=A0AAD5T209_9FUNG|nr:membrane-bound alpha-1,6- mannosyltransferase Initiation-specific [Physocladia obscura]
MLALIREFNGNNGKTITTSVAEGTKGNLSGIKGEAPEVEKAIELKIGKEGAIEVEGGKQVDDEEDSGDWIAAVDMDRGDRWNVGGSDGAIPALIHQTYLSHATLDWERETSATPSRLEWHRSWDSCNAPQSHFRHVVWNAANAVHFLRTRFEPRVHEAYALLPHYVLKGDFLRYALLYELGGVYSDSDTVCHKPIDLWRVNSTAYNPHLIVAVWGFQSYLTRKEPTNLVQWTMAAKPHHPLLKRVVYTLVDNILNHKSIASLNESEVDYFTGPVYWTKSIIEYLGEHNETFDSLVSPEVDSVPEWYPKSKTLILPINSFRADAQWAHPYGVDHRYSFVSHIHAGSWVGGWKNAYSSDVVKKD